MLLSPPFCSAFLAHACIWHMIELTELLATSTTRTETSPSRLSVRVEPGALETPEEEI